MATLSHNRAAACQSVQQVPWEQHHSVTQGRTITHRPLTYCQGALRITSTMTETSARLVSMTPSLAIASRASAFVVTPPGGADMSVLRLDAVGDMAAPGPGTATGTGTGTGTGTAGGMTGARGPGTESVIGVAPAPGKGGGTGIGIVGGVTGRAIGGGTSPTAV